VSVVGSARVRNAARASPHGRGSQPDRNSTCGNPNLSLSSFPSRDIALSPSLTFRLSYFPKHAAKSKHKD